MTTKPEQMNIDAQLVKKLRELTGAGFSDCRAALVEAGGDIEKAVDVLCRKGQAAAQKKAQREATEGESLIGHYIHAGGKIGVVIEINCESDFVARTEDFQRLCHDVAMHVAALDPRYVRREEVTQQILDHEREIYREQARATGKPGAGDRKNCHGQNGKVLRGELPVRAALHQGRIGHRRRTHQSDDLEIGRKHLDTTIRSLEGRRSTSCFSGRRGLNRRCQRLAGGPRAGDTP